MNDFRPAKGFDVFRDPEVLRVIEHPLRLRSFTEAVKGPVSAKDLSSRFDEPLPKMSYHVRALADAGLLTPVRRTRRRGAIETHYRAVATLDVHDEALESASDEVVAQWVQTQIRVICEDALHAFDRGAERERDFVVSRSNFVVNEEGRRRLREELDEMYQRIARLERELRVEPGEDTVSLNLAFLWYAGERAKGRHDPFLCAYGTDDVPTIPPD